MAHRLAEPLGPTAAILTPWAGVQVVYRVDSSELVFPHRKGYSGAMAESMKCSGCGGGVEVQGSLTDCAECGFALIATDGVRDLRIADIASLSNPDLRRLRDNYVSWFKPAASRCPGCFCALAPGDENDIGACPGCGEISLAISGELVAIAHSELRSRLGAALRYVELARAIARELRRRR